MLRELNKWVKRWRNNRKRPNQSFQPTPAISYYGDQGTATTLTSFINSTNVSAGTIRDLSADQTMQLAESKKAPSDDRIEKKPVEVVSEIVVEKPVLQLNDIKTQIKIVEARLKVLRKHRGQTNDEECALRYLNARKYYTKHEKLFYWAVSTNQLIEALVKKYKLADRSFGAYSKSVPIEATNELEKFGKAWDKVVDDPDWQPNLKLITDYTGPETKKDPILLAESPFGRWWYVLGAWDKEVEIVDKIIYRGQ